MHLLSINLVVFFELQAAVGQHDHDAHSQRWCWYGDALHRVRRKKKLEEEGCGDGGQPRPGRKGPAASNREREGGEPGKTAGTKLGAIL
jgi:hypothetical protein